MITLGIRYLFGWAGATEPNSYDDPEWPPHPARVFMAMAAAYFETRGEPRTSAQEEEREALEWLEAQGAPNLYASEAEHALPVTTYVPVNDTRITSRRPSSASRQSVERSLRVLPAHRSRQPRTFPRAIPDDDTVWLRWPEADPTARLSRALQRVCRKVNRVGHSSSMVQMWVAEDGDTPAPNLVAESPAPTDRLRVPAAGMLSELEAQYNAGLRPSVSLWERYGPPPSAGGHPGSLFDPDLLVVSLEAGASKFRRLGLESTAQIIDYFRRAVLSAAEEPVPEYLSGHRPDGSPSTDPHAAFLPLAFVGHPHADGHLLGLGVAVPGGLPPEARQRIHAALARLMSPPRDDGPGNLLMGRLGRWRLEPVTEEAPPRTLRPETWTAPSHAWASVTPLVLDRFTHDDDEKRALVALACERVGLPRPSDVRLSHVSPHFGVPPSPRFGPLPVSGDRPARPFTHAILTFAREDGSPLAVRGPVLIGAGRFRGYGLFRPIHNSQFRRR